MSAKGQKRTLRGDTQCGRGHPSVALKRRYFFSPCPDVVGVVVVGGFL
jgi:hypothetical protein